MKKPWAKTLGYLDSRLHVTTANFTNNSPGTRPGQIKGNKKPPGLSTRGLSARSRLTSPALPDLARSIQRSSGGNRLAIRTIARH
ncbi:hypothetical protein 20Aug470_00003 [Pseudomonas phage 20Aug470]|nr:hypothetical protein 20Aug470_00003 [Pseudomonas phage 20Aug470]